MSPTQFGYPNDRPRYYCLACKKGQEQYHANRELWNTNENEIHTFIPSVSNTSLQVRTIKDYINDLKEVKGLEVRTQSLSTEVFGEFDLVMDAIKETTKKYFEADPSTILVAKFLNRDRRKEIS